MRRLSIALPSSALALVCACGGTQDSAPAARPQDAARSGAAESARLGGRVVVTGLPARYEHGTLELALWNAPELGRAGALPLLVRCYDLADPDWTRAGEVLSRYFGLDDSHRVGDSARAFADGLVLEAKLVADGGPEGPRGSWSATLGVRNGESDLQLDVPTQTATAQPDRRRKQGG